MTIWSNKFGVRFPGSASGQGDHRVLGRCGICCNEGIERGSIRASKPGSRGTHRAELAAAGGAQQQRVTMAADQQLLDALAAPWRIPAAQPVETRARPADGGGALRGLLTQDDGASTHFLLLAGWEECATLDQTVRFPGTTPTIVKLTSAALAKELTRGFLGYRQPMDGPWRMIITARPRGAAAFSAIDSHAGPADSRSRIGRSCTPCRSLPPAAPRSRCRYRRGCSRRRRAA